VEKELIPQEGLIIEHASIKEEKFEALVSLPVYYIS
jgi:hypothetical protein